MWTNINTLEIAENIMPGSVIAIDPDQVRQACVVTTVTPDSITAVNRRKNNMLVILPKREVISGKWWVEHKLLA